MADWNEALRRSMSVQDGDDVGEYVTDRQLFKTKQLISHRDAAKVFSFDYRNKMTANRRKVFTVVTILSIYGLLATYALAEIEVLCLRGTVPKGPPPKAGAAPTGGPPKDGFGKWVAQHYCEPTDNRTTRKDFKFCLQKTDDEKLVIMKQQCPMYEHEFWLRLSLTLTTAFALIGLVLYYIYDFRLMMFDNSLAPGWRITSFWFYFKIVIEALILAVHPIFLYDTTFWFVKYFPLYYLTLGRLWYVLRCILLNSSLFESTKCQSVASLNGMTIRPVNATNMRLILRIFWKNYGLSLWAIYVIVHAVVIGYSVHLAEGHHAYYNPDRPKEIPSFFDVFFYSLSAGKITHYSVISKVFLVWLFLSHIGRGGLLLGWLTGKLTMSVKERKLFKSVAGDSARKRVDAAAATVLQRAWRSSLKGEVVMSKPMIKPSPKEKRINPGATPQQAFCAIVHCQSMYEAILNFRNLRVARKFSSDNAHAPVDIGIQQGKINQKVSKLSHTVDSLQKNVADIQQRRDAMAGTLSELCQMVKELSEKQ